MTGVSRRWPALDGRAPWYAAAIVAAAIGAIFPRALSLNDWSAFHPAGQALLAGDLSVFGNDDRLMTGPLALLAFGLLPAPAVAAAVGGVLWVLALRLASPDLTWREAVAGVVGYVPWMAASAQGHLDDQLAGVLLVASVFAAGRGWWAGLAVMCKPSALLAVVTLDRKSLLPFVAVCAAVSAPFLIADPAGLLRSGDWAIGTQPAAPVHLVYGGHLPGWWRAAQLAVVLLVAWLATRRAGPLAGVLAGSCARVMLEPGDFGYYAAGIAVLAAVWAVRGRGWAPLALSWVIMVGVAFPHGDALRAWALLTVIALAAGSTSEATAPVPYRFGRPRARGLAVPGR